ncbi:MAG: methylase [Methylomonas sp.]|nr:MAG: methylase [Methylomonas sp.]
MMPVIKTFSQACENNKLPILNIISQVFIQSTTVWEIGSGTGQHACFFASQLPHLSWQATDRIEKLAGIQAWIAEANLPNLKPPLALDINDRSWPCQSIDALFSANTLHIISMVEVETLFDRLSQYLNPDGLVCCYGPFNYAGQYTSDSNARFDQWLKAQNPLSGIRDFESICQLAACIGLNLLNDHAMPANNRLLVFQKSP